MKSVTINFNLKRGLPQTRKISFDFDLTSLKVKFVTVPQNASLTYSTKIGGNISKETNEFSGLTHEGIDELYISASTTDETSVVVIVVEYEYAKFHTTKHKWGDNLKLDGMVDMANKLEVDMQLFVAGVDGIQVVWYRTMPVADDVILKEYSGRKYVEQKCLRILTEENMYPEIIDAEFTEYGIETIDFPAEISASYFEEIFGCGVTPRDGDWVLIPATNRALKISNVVSERGIDGSVLIWKLTLSNFYEEVDVEDDDEFIDHTQSHEKIFGAETMEEIENVINEKQNTTPQIYGDMNRSSIGSDVGYSVVSDGSYMYALSGGQDGLKAVVYKPVKEPVRAISMLVSPSEDCVLLASDAGNIAVVNGSLKVFGMSSGYTVEPYEKVHIIVSLFDKFTATQVIDFSGKEVYYNQDMSPRLVSGEFSLLYGDTEIGKIKLAKKVVLRKDGVKMATTKMETNAGSFFVIDDAIQPYNNPRAKESQFRTNL